MSIDNIDNSKDISTEEIEKCIAILERLVADTNQVFEIPKPQRTALIKASGQLSRPSREEFSRRKKDAKKAAKRKQAARDKNARKATGIRSAREAHIFVAPKLLPEADLKAKEQLELESPRNCYVCKKLFTKLHHFYDTMCTECGDFNYVKRFQTADVKGQVAVIKNWLSYYFNVVERWCNSDSYHTFSGRFSFAFFTRRRLYRMGTSFKDSWLRLKTYSECRNLL